MEHICFCSFASSKLNPSVWGWLTGNNTQQRPCSKTGTEKKWGEMGGLHGEMGGNSKTPGKCGGPRTGIGTGPVLALWEEGVQAVKALEGKCGYGGETELR